MTRDEALTIVGMISNHWPGPQWNTDTLDAYAHAIQPLDARLATAAVIRAVNELEFYPKVSVLREYVQIERRLAEPEPPADRMEPRTDFRREPPSWIRTWIISRYRHRDFRVLPEQKPGYDTLQTGEPHFRTYVWPDQEPMPSEQAAVYAAEGAGLSVEDVFHTLTT
jgi:hypothetical protein